MGMTTDMGIRPGMHTFSMTAGLGDIGTCLLYTSRGQTCDLSGRAHGFHTRQEYG